MKLVQFQCTVAVCRARNKRMAGGAEEVEEEEVKSHTIWVNPKKVQMLAPCDKRYPEEVSIFFDGDDSTSVEGSFEEVIEKLTTA